MIVACMALLGGCAAGVDPVEFANPRIGSGGHGHVFVGASVPFGMVQLGPTSIPQKWDWCSGYHASDSTVIGFSHTHLSGTGIGDLFDVTVMPVVGDVTYARGTEDDPLSGLWSYADRSREVARPGYYSVPLMRYGITAEMTATERVGMHRYTFPASDESALVFDLLDGGYSDHPVDTWVEVIDSVTIAGWRHSKGWSKNQKQFFYAIFSKPFTPEFIEGEYISPRRGTSLNPPKFGTTFARFGFATAAGEQVLLKVALSSTGVEGARAAMEAELPGWDFDAVRREASSKWNAALSKIRIPKGSRRDRNIFYTALYHTMIAPSLFCDVDGSYRGADSLVHADPGHKTFTTYSLWDTYRSAMPLYDIIHPELRADMVSNMVDIFDEQGKLPVWHLMACETNCMVGAPGAIVVADAIVKGFGGFDRERAYQACKATMMLPYLAQDVRMEYGYVPCDLVNQACARDMEYAIADAAVANAAAALGHTEDERYFRERSHSWSNYFDATTGFVRGRMADGSWREPFNPYFSERYNDYCEGNAWQYTWLVPHDLALLTELYGGREVMLGHLDELFETSSDLGENPAGDMTGLIGQYVHGNEPSHHIVYFYTMAGQPWKTADRVRQILAEMYGDGYDGLAGNEDVGQMSAWYVLSALGFHPVEQGSKKYWFGTPLFERADIAVAGGTFRIKAPGVSDGARYIQSVELNGKPYREPFISFDDIDAGGTLVLHMGTEPAVWYEIP